MASEAAKDLLHNLQTAGQGYEAGDPESTRKILEICKDLRAVLEPPGQTWVRTMWGEPLHAAAIRIALDLDIFQTLSRDGGSPKSSAQLAAPRNADRVLVARLMRHLAAMSTVREVDRDQYIHWTYSRELATNPAAVDGFKFMYDDYWRAYMATPQWLADRNWQNPENARDTPAAFIWDVPDTTLFEYFTQHPEKGRVFGAMMTVQASGKTMWADEGAYPGSERLGCADEDDVLVVDVGGGVGHDLLGFKARHPELKGRLVLQDLAHVIQAVGEAHGIELMEHDFYTLQPVKGAHAYFLHQILHDYSDETCRKILRQLTPAMEKGKSKILINELVLPDQGAHWFTTTLDLAVMNCLSGQERTEYDFRDLFASVGLEVQGVWKHPQGYDSVIELSLAEE